MEQLPLGWMSYQLDVLSVDSSSSNTRDKEAKAQALPKSQRKNDRNIPLRNKSLHNFLLLSFHLIGLHYFMQCRYLGSIVVSLSTSPFCVFGDVAAPDYAMPCLADAPLLKLWPEP